MREVTTPAEELYKQLPSPPPMVAEQKIASMEKKHHLRLDIIFDRSAQSDASDRPVVEGIRFFAARSFGASTWFVSLVVILQLLAFTITMFVNNCPEGPAAGACSVKSLGRFSFQPMSENPLLGPSASTLATMGALQRESIVRQHQHWRLLVSPLLNAGLIHLTVNIFSILLFAIRLEQDYGPLRIGIISMFSGFIGALSSFLFLEDVPEVGSSGCLFGLLGAMLSGLLQNWEIYDGKLSALFVLAFVAAVNFILGMLPYVDNFANMGGFLSGIVLGFLLLFDPQLGKMERRKGLYDYSLTRAVKLKRKLDRPLRRVLSLLLFVAILAGSLRAVVVGFDANRICRWCHYIDCIPSSMWVCRH